MADLLYIRARAALLDAAEALEAHRDALVLVGAQAVYLHTGDADLTVAAYTTDADFTVAPGRSPSGRSGAFAFVRANVCSRLRAGPIGAGKRPLSSVCGRSWDAPQGTRGTREFVLCEVRAVSASVAG